MSFRDNAMCGRFALNTTSSKIKSQFIVETMPEIEPRFNIAPSQDVLILMKTEDGLRAEHFKWGLVPYFAKDKVIAPPLINARAETVNQKPAFRDALKSRRGLVLMSGFFEWVRSNDIKQPYYISKTNDELIAFAALWDCWTSREGETIYSCCVLTTEANDLMSQFHDRMPVILTPEEQDLWLNRKEIEPQNLLSIAHPYSGSDLQVHPVTTKMNNWRFIDSQALKNYLHYRSKINLNKN